MTSRAALTVVVGSVFFGAHCSAAAPAIPPEPTDTLWGFADLHAHPAFHLAYGATVASTSDLAQSGIMFGLPGLAYDAHTEATDLAPCDGDSHGKANPLANVLLTQLAKVLETPHGQNGYPSFDNWPLATAGLHQQMHVSWLHRAWEGGQRLMVASVVENALLAGVFSGNLHPPAATAIHDAERKAVDAQIDFIANKLVANNTSWLALAKSSDDARTAIAAGKMAIVLGTEFDTLDLQEMNELYDAGVRVFIPIHLADNDLGGTAVYTDVFNLHNAYVRGVGYKIAHDDLLSFALSLDIPPVELFGLPLPNPFENTNVGIRPGHRNSQGLTDVGKAMIQALIDKGAIIDVAHMGQESTADTLTIAEAAQVPVMDSHTSVRPKSEVTGTERDLRFEDARRIGALGGMIGISTAGNTSDTSVKSERMFYSSPFAKITKDVPFHSDGFPSSPPDVPCKGLLFSVWTANDDLREAATLTVNGAPFDLNQGFTVANDQALTVMVPLPENTKSSQIDAELDHVTNGDLLKARGPDQWNIGGIRLACGPLAFSSKTSSATPGATFDDTTSIATMTIDTKDPTMVSIVPIDVWTQDALDDHPLDIDVHTKSGVATGCTDLLARGDGTREKLESSSIRHLVCVLPNPVAMNDVDSVSLHLSAGGNWKIKAWTVGLDDGSASKATFVDKDYVPPLEVLDQPLILASHVLEQAMVRISITTAPSGLEPDIDATATLHFHDGTDQLVRLNRKAPITAGRLDLGFNISVPIATTFQFYAPLGNGHLSSQIESIRIDAPNIQGEWPITQVVLEAFEEPALRWVEDLASVTTTLGQSDCFAPNRSCGVALGTDLNGLAPTIPGTSVSPYDSMQPGKFILDYPPELGGRGTIVGLSATGPTKTWDVMKDGIAHVGLLPDFLVAAAHVTRSDGTQPSAARVVSTIFHSAGDFVRMWAKVEKKKK